MFNPKTIAISGPLEVHVDGFWTHLLGLGYAPLSARNQLYVFSHLSRWLDQQALELHDLSGDQVGRFLSYRRAEGFVSHLSPSGLDQVLNYLRGAGVVPPEAPPPGPLPKLDQWLCQYREYLVTERALGPQIVALYQKIARQFLSCRFGKRKLHFDRLAARDVTTFVLKESKGTAVGTAKLLVTALRSLLKFLYIRGELALDLTGAVPSVAGWRLRGLPKGLAPQEVKELLRGCDRRKHVGRRDYAVLLLLVRLGLRAIEVARLTLDDIDWSEGELTIHGKGGRQDCLPLTEEVGAAMASYLHRSRPCCRFRSVFATVRAPVRPLTSGAVASIAYYVGQRIGLPVSARILRHTAATQMLRNGASLSDIAQVLRHQSTDTTAIYAKVDERALRMVCRPWPGGAS
jgi:site-specific recombinase XerD